MYRLSWELYTHCVKKMFLLLAGQLCHRAITNKWESAMKKKKKKESRKSSDDMIYYKTVMIATY